MPAKKLSVGIVLPDYKIPAWQKLAVRNVADLACVDIKAVFVVGADADYRDQYPQFELSHWLLRLLIKFDSRLFRYKRRPDALAIVDTTEVFGNVEEFRIEPNGDPGVQILNSRDCSAVSATNLDILIDAGVWLSQTHCDLARYGIWRIVHHPSCAPGHAMPGFWETLDGHPVTGSRLEVLHAANGLPLVADTSWSTTYHLSPSVNRNHFSWTSSLFLVRQICNLVRIGERQFFFDLQARTGNIDVDSQRMRSVRTTRSAIFYWFKYASKIARRVVYEKIYWDQWYLLYSLDSATPNSIRDFAKIVPPKDEFWADPHVVRRGDLYFVFLEVYSKRSKKAHISVLEIDKYGNYSEPTKILEADYHLSYPMIVEDSGKLFMIPETKGNHSIEIYECVEFPRRWEFRMNLMSTVDAADATPLWYKGRWWLFVAVVSVSGSQCREELYIFHSEKLLSDEWVPHPLNPVVSDARSARPAGKIFFRNGKLIRPSQDCSYKYGYGLVFNEIKELSETEFVEERLSTITPAREFGELGIHSYSREGSLTVVDAMRRVRRW